MWCPSDPRLPSRWTPDCQPGFVYSSFSLFSLASFSSFYQFGKNIHFTINYSYFTIRYKVNPSSFLNWWKKLWCIFIISLLWYILLSLWQVIKFISLLSSKYLFVVQYMNLTLYLSMCFVLCSIDTYSMSIKISIFLLIHYLKHQKRDYQLYNYFIIYQSSGIQWII